MVIEVTNLVDGFVDIYFLKYMVISTDFVDNFLKSLDFYLSTKYKPNIYLFQIC